MYAAYVAAGLFAWRLAWHIHLYPAMEYGGAYTSPEDAKRARKGFFRTLPLIVPLALLSVYALWP
jgi:hypothetical protein